MDNIRLLTRAAVAILAALVCAAPASAQRPRPDRPYRGLFGGNGADPNSTQQLDLNASLFGAYDDNVLANQLQFGVDPRFQQSGGYGTGTVSLDYTRRAGRATFDFTGGTTYRYYPSLSQLDGANSFVSAGLTAKLSSRTNFSATESASYSPFYSLGAIPGMMTPSPGEIAPIGSDYPLLLESALSLYSSASLEHRLTPRASLTADYTLQYTDYRTGNQVLDNWAAGGRFGYRLTSRASLRLGYHYRRSTSPLYFGGQPVVGHDIDVGIDYNRALSFSRKTTVGFTTGTSIYRSFTSNGSLISTDWAYKTHFLATGSAYLNRQMGRSWTGRLSYQRGLQFVPGFGNPFFADSVSASLGGFVGARSNLNLSAYYSSGQLGIVTTGQGYKSYVGAADYQFALSRFVALSANYTYYHYLFDPTVVLLPGMNRGLNRQSVRVGLNLWLPLLR
jgi:hypothetical protein